MAIRKSGISGIPFGNTAARPANPVIGTVYYNGQLEIIEIYNGTSWVANSAPPAVPSVVRPLGIAVPTSCQALPSHTLINLAIILRTSL